MTPLKKMRKSELIALLENRESAFTEQEKEIETLAKRVDEQRETIDRLTYELKTTGKQNIDLTNDNKSLKNSLGNKDYTISDLREDCNRLRDRANELWETGEKLDRELRDAKNEIGRLRSGNDTLLDLVKTLQPKENQKTVKCEKGEWCKTCTFNKPVTFIRNGDRIYLDICMKNCSCNNFVAKED